MVNILRSYRHYDTFTSNNWSSAIAYHILFDLDQIGWISNTLFIGGNNLPADASSGGYNGLQAIINLGDKDWIIT
jgi:hypothetical protein